MNKRIKELYNTAQVLNVAYNITKIVGADKLNFDSYLVEKFAQLIVSKCIELMDESYRGDMYTGDVYASEYNNCINEQVETLQDYFGVNK